MKEIKTIKFIDDIDPNNEIERIERNRAYLMNQFNSNKDFFNNIPNLENFLYYAICDYTVGSSEINEVLSKQDSDYLSLVSKYIEETIYPQNKNRYVVGESHNLTMIYFDVYKEEKGAIPFTMILDREYLHLNTCINIMERNNGELSHYNELFSYTYYEELYNFVLGVCDALLKGKDNYSFFNHSKFVENLTNLSLDQLLILKCFAEARLSLSNIKDRTEENDIKLLDYVSNIVFEAYNNKNRNKNHKLSRTCGKHSKN